jgi:hypothetical protein
MGRGGTRVSLSIGSTPARAAVLASSREVLDEPAGSIEVAAGEFRRAGSELAGAPGGV